MSKDEKRALAKKKVEAWIEYFDYLRSVDLQKMIEDDRRKKEKERMAVDALHLSRSGTKIEER